MNHYKIFKKFRRFQKMNRPEYILNEINKGIKMGMDSISSIKVAMSFFFILPHLHYLFEILNLLCIHITPVLIFLDHEPTLPTREFFSTYNNLKL